MKAYDLSFDTNLERYDEGKSAANVDTAKLTVRTFRNWEDISRLSGIWNELLVESSAATICLTYEWLESWWIAYRASRELFVVGLFKPGGEMIGIAPFYRTSHPDHTGTKLPIRVLRFLGTGTDGTSTSLGLIFRAGYEVAGVRKLLQYLSEKRSEWDILDLHLMPAEAPMTLIMTDEIERIGWLLLQNNEPHLIVPLPDQYDKYLSSLSKKMRSELPYEHRRLLRQFKVDFRKIQTDDELPQATGILFRLNTQRWQARGKGGSFHNHEKRIFCQEMAKRFLARGWLDFWFLDLNDDTAAIEYGFRYKDTYYPLWVALNTEYKKYEAGSVLRSLIIQTLIADGIHFYELMNGAEPYKLRWGAEQRYYKNLSCVLPYSRGALYWKISSMLINSKVYFGSLRQRLRNFLSSILPSWAYNFLKNAYHRLKRP
jgi:CelD/BcsL family acetyltransferase involved in cellulose biosynthesis